MRQRKFLKLGKLYKYLTPIECVGPIKTIGYSYKCKCKCGKIIIVSASNVLRKNTRSCGCWGRSHNFKHGYSGTSIYITWTSMKSRCFNPSDQHYPYYGAKGIKVCKRWLKFENFLKDMGIPPTPRHSLDRIDNSGNYCKKNCRWATAKEQNRNQTTNHLITYKGRTQCLAAWAEEYGIGWHLLWDRMHRSHPPMSFEEAINYPMGHRRKRGKYKKKC